MQWTQKLRTHYTLIIYPVDGYVMNTVRCYCCLVQPWRIYEYMTQNKVLNLNYIILCNVCASSTDRRCLNEFRSGIELEHNEARYRSKEHGHMTIISSGMMYNRHVAS
jgi:hypothetical protein